MGTTSSMAPIDSWMTQPLDSFQTGANNLFTSTYGTDVGAIGSAKLDSYGYGQGGETSFLGESFSTLDKTLGTVGKIGTIGSSLAQAYVGLKALDLAEEELDIKKDQWKMSKEELQHMQASRKRITTSYMA